MLIYYMLRFSEVDIVPMSESGAEFVARDFIGKEVVISGRASINVASAYFDKKKGIVLVSSSGEQHTHIPVVGTVRPRGVDKCKNCNAELRMGVQMFPCSNCLVETICHICKAHCGKCKSKPMCKKCIESHTGTCVVSKKT